MLLVVVVVVWLVVVVLVVVSVLVMIDSGECVVIHRNACSCVSRCVGGAWSDDGWFGVVDDLLNAFLVEPLR